MPWIWVHLNENIDIESKRELNHVLLDNRDRDSGRCGRGERAAYRNVSRNSQLAIDNVTAVMVSPPAITPETRHPL